MCPFKINIDFMKSTNPKITHKQKEQSNPSQQNNEKQLVQANDFQKFFKLEFDSLNYFVDQEMSKLKEEFESELMNSKSLLNKYRNLRRLCDKKLEFDQFKLWNDNHNYHHFLDFRRYLYYGDFYDVLLEYYYHYYHLQCKEFPYHFVYFHSL